MDFPMKIAQKACALAVEIALLLFVVLIVLAPFHGRATRHLTVTQTLEPTLVSVEGDAAALSIERGDRLTLYRFNHSWKAPIGSGVVEQITERGATLRIDPRDMSWPIGRHGTVSLEDGRAYVSLGSAQNLRVGDMLNLFHDRAPIAQVPIIRTEGARSEIQLPPGIAIDPTMLTASEYTYATQATVYDNRLLSGIELGTIALVLAAYTLTYLRIKRSPFLLVGEQLRRLPISRRAVFWIVHLLVGIPLIWFLAKMPLYLVAYVASYLSLHLFDNYIYLYGSANTLLPYAYALVAAAYFGYLFYRRESPILAFWHLISYKGASGVQQVPFRRGLILWALHLIIVYAFAATLLGFLQGDLAAAVAIGFPAPTIEAWFEQMKFLIWALTVVGVLIGYGYSVLSILWGKYIRNLDFTVTGWLTNGFCYPLFGVVIWQMTPAFTGIDPIVTAGPLLYLMLVMGLVLNFLYMLSIFNLGTLFDLMTDKGVRTSGFYSVIRHPNYTLESAMFVVTELVGLTAGIHWLGISMYVFLYWIRSEREDNFMQWSNPDYVKYQKETPWKFIPGIY